MRIRHGVAAVGVAVLVLLGADTVVWRIATGRLAEGYAGWQDRLAASGWQVTSDPPVAVGWPFAAQLELGHARLGERDPAGFGWSAERVRFGIALWHPGTLAVAPGGAEMVAVPGRAAVRMQAPRLVATVPLAAPVTAVRVRAEGVSIGLAEGDAVVQAAALDLDWASGGARAELSAGPVALPEGHRWGLGQSIAALTLSAVARGAWPAGKPAAAAAAWRDAGGAVDIGAVGLRWGMLDASGSGTLRLDAGLQPDATLSVRLVDPQAAVSMLADTGAIGAGTATAIGAVLGLLALPARLAGEPAVLNLPLRVSGGVATLGQIPVLKIPAVRWGAP